MRPWISPPRLEAVSAFGATPAGARRSLDELGLANRFCRGTASILAALAPLLAGSARRGSRVLDVGSGGADIARGLVHCERRAGRSLGVVALDRHAEAIARGVANSPGFAEIVHLRADAFALPFAAGSFDFVLSSMMLHYFSLDDARRLIAGFARVATRAVLIAEIERHWLPYLAIGVLARLTGDRLIRRYFRETVQQGFTRSELAALAETAGFVRWRVRRHFPFRLVLVGELGDAG